MESPLGEWHVVPDLEVLSRTAANELCKVLSNAIAARGKASFVLSGGKTPRPLYTMLAGEFRETIDWSKIDFFWGDERYVPPEHEASNFGFARGALLQPLNISPDRIHRMPTESGDPANAALSYERHLQEYFGSSECSFDLLLLGMGADGHVASLFPGSPALQEKNRLVVVTNAPATPVTRLSLTFRALNAASTVMILVAGSEKREILTWIERSEHRKTFPISRVTARNRLLWYVDQAASGTAP